MYLLWIIKCINSRYFCYQQVVKKRKLDREEIKKRGKKEINIYGKLVRDAYSCPLLADIMMEMTNQSVSI